MLYSRPQLRLMLVIAALFLVGLAVREWRAGFPELADRLERFDRDTSTAPESAPSTSESLPPNARAPAKLSAVARSPQDTAPAQSSAPPVVDQKPLDINQAGVAELSRLP